MKDITGIRSGLLTAIAPTKQRNNYGVVWECKCECGNTCYKNCSSLVNQRVKSCGCLKHPDLSGIKYGKLTVNKFSGKTDNSRRKLWECQCECGNILLIPTTDLTRNRKKSCGCDKSVSIERKKFGKLTVLKQIGSDKHQKSIWKCKCECGQVVELKRQQLSRGYATSCGCENNDYTHKDIKKFHWLSILYNAGIRSLTVKITPRYAYNLFVSQNKKCALSGKDIRFAANQKEHRSGLTTASLDRIDSTLGYLPNNIQWVHKVINRLKQNLDEDKLTSLVTEMYFHSLHRHGKPNWDKYYMQMARLASVRSIDPNTKHGCVIVDQNNRALSIGYNGPIKNIDDQQVPLVRPDKYYWMSHAEQNAIMFCNGSMKSSTIYVTGRPCAFCTRMLIQKEIRRIIHGNVTSLCVDKDDLAASTKMLELSGVEIEEYND